MVAVFSPFMVIRDFGLRTNPYPRMSLPPPKPSGMPIKGGEGNAMFSSFQNPPFLPILLSSKINLPPTCLKYQNPRAPNPLSRHSVTYARIGLAKLLISIVTSTVTLPMNKNENMGMFYVFKLSYTWLISPHRFPYCEECDRYFIQNVNYRDHMNGQYVYTQHLIII